MSLTSIFRCCVWAPPTVMVHASYPGASAETIQKSVIIPLEEAINGVENMMYIKSEASNERRLRGQPPVPRTPFTVHVITV